MIIKRKDKWILKFSDGREEDFSSEEAAKKREKQVNYFKYLDKHPSMKKGK